ncbi:MAG: IMP cyclohydrolase [Candidatus Geothermarchaeales archaeon]
MSEGLDRLREMYSTRVEEDFPSTYKVKWGELEVELVKSPLRLRYGTNPHQKAALYVPRGTLWDNVKLLKTGKSGLSQTNVEDVDRATRILRYFDGPACAVMKHLVPSGFAAARDGESLRETYVRARDCDSQAAFGSVVAFNCGVDEGTAEEIVGTYVEVVAATGYEGDAPRIFERKKNMRVIEYQRSDLEGLGRFVGDPITPRDLEIGSLLGGSLVLSDPLLTRVRGRGDLFCVTKRCPTDREFEDLIFSWYVCLGARSNGVVCSKDACTVSIGTGQQDRVTAVKIALDKACDRGHREDLKGSVLASDGFFPFRDSIDLMAEYGVSAVVQPGGSIRDQEVIDACDEHGIAMAFTGERCFGHF